MLDSSRSPFVRLQSWLDALLIQELFEPLFAAVLRVALLGLIQLGVKIVLALLPGKFTAALEPMFCCAQNDGVLLYQFARERDGFLAELFKRHGPVDQAHLRSLFPGECFSGHDVLERFALSHCIRQRLAHQVARRDAPVDFRQTKDRGF